VMRYFDATGAWAITILPHPVITLAAKLVTQRADLALKCINLAVPAKDHA
jgi:hypothetical protein